ncbi:hypothetical protein ACFV5G_40195 [Streptomyces sp. NPDC059766]|uniref:hypothetical protein n=1 Tax=Streptomyces sp. NPDC059766 TaxID=3346940 RepID=UPI003653B8A5
MPVDPYDDRSGVPAGDPFEDRLSAALQATGSTFDTDRAALAAGGAARGRRRQLLRRTAVVGSVAGIALVGVGGALLVPWGGSSAAQPSSVAAQPRPAGSKSSPSPSPSPAVFSRDDMIRTLEKLLPGGTFSGQDGRGTDGRFPPSAQVVFDDGKGASAVSVGVDRVQPGSDQARQATQCPDKVFTLFDACTTTHLADGSVLMVLQGYEYPDKREDTKMWTAELITPAGQHISVQEWNAAAEKGSPVTRPEPALSVARLTEVATAKEWREVADARPAPEEPSAPSAPAPPEPDGKAIVRTLTGLLPKGMKVVTKSADDTEFAYLVLDDGKGRSYVQINVQPRMSDLAGELFGGAEKLPDGTLVTSRQGPGEKGGSGVVMWTVDTLRTDGLRVVISGFNAAGQQTDATRATPALTMKQLRTIAVSPKWRTLG